jgi:peptidoglycan/LPS O-acetylase OafA/YrhL
VRRAFAPLQPILQGLIALVMSLALAWAIYVVVERPCARLRRHLQRNKAWA